MLQFILKCTLPLTKRLAIASVKFHGWLLEKYLSRILDGDVFTAQEILQDKSSKPLLHQVLDGPLPREAYDTADEEGIPYDMQYLLFAKIEVDGELMNVNLWYKNEEEAQEVANHFKTSIEPLELDW